ncbi:clip-associated protein [Anaeramoeba flamelloides]|uniref:Clip-associated protein n=1 Tax=Anaeramoeba flamelloides TaxID=1746091 RepID=A0AAV7ZPJ0_9EUKA|nr:clip-associated protein [Anaeramoeba flamelloides]
MKKNIHIHIPKENINKNNNNQNQNIKRNIIQKKNINRNIIQKENINSNIIRKKSTHRNIIHKKNIKRNVIQKVNINSNIIQKENINSNIIQKKSTHRNIIQKENINKSIIQKDNISSSAIQKKSTHRNIIQKENINNNIIKIEKNIKAKNKNDPNKNNLKLENNQIGQMIDILLTTITRKNKIKSIEMLIQLSNEKLPKIWDVHFKKIAVVILHCFQNPNKNIRKHLFKLIQKMSVNQKEKFYDSTRLLVFQLIESFKGLKVNYIAENNLLFKQLIKVLNPEITLNVIIEFLDKKDSSMLKTTLSLLRELCPYLNKELLLAKINIILNKTVELLNHSESEIRRLVILFIVRFYDIIGSNFEKDYLLNTVGENDLKLIQVYRQKELKYKKNHQNEQIN